jgi:hypothetical protein
VKDFDGENLLKTDYMLAEFFLCVTQCVSFYSSE